MEEIVFLPQGFRKESIRYKKIFMTLIGISGCTALLLTGFGLRDSIGRYSAQTVR